MDYVTTIYEYFMEILLEVRWSETRSSLRIAHMLRGQISLQLAALNESKRYIRGRKMNEFYFQLQHLEDSLIEHKTQS